MVDLTKEGMVLTNPRKHIRKHLHQSPHVKQAVLMILIEPGCKMLGLYSSADASSGKSTFPQGCIVSEDDDRGHDQDLTGDTLFWASHRTLSGKLGLRPKNVRYIMSFRGSCPECREGKGIKAVDYHVVACMAPTRDVLLNQKKKPFFQWVDGKVLLNICACEDDTFMSSQKRDFVVRALEAFANKPAGFLQTLDFELPGAEWIHELRHKKDRVSVAA